MPLNNNLKDNKSGMKRVLVLVPEFPRLTETFIQREISKLIELGNLDVTVFAMAKATGKLMDNVKGHVVYKRLSVVSGIRAFFYFLPQLAKVLRVYFWFIRQSLAEKEACVLKAPYFFAKSCGYAYLFAEETPEYIHANFMSWPSTMALIASKLLDIPYSISAHAKDVMVEGEYFEAKVASAKFIAICNVYAYKSCLDQSGKKDPKNVLLRYHGIDPSKAFDVDVSVEKPARVVLCNVGDRLVAKKGQKYLIEAAKILKDRGYDFELHIGGPGPLYEELMAQIKDLGLTDVVFIHGEGEGVPFETVVSYLKIADIVVKSNINLGSGDADGIPTSVIEAAMMGKPVVATDAGSVTDLIVNEETGLIVSQRNPEELAEAVVRLLDNPDLASELASSAKEKAFEMFDLTRNVQEIEQLILN
ncbi:glycosyltransferase [candidate division WWE3 bacterium]|nr:glycosyltransferase [candidate division WWE3 bacterium]